MERAMKIQEAILRAMAKKITWGRRARVIDIEIYAEALQCGKHLQTRWETAFPATGHSESAANSFVGAFVRSDNSANRPLLVTHAVVYREEFGKFGCSCSGNRESRNTSGCVTPHLTFP
jgi:hypothetical protein